MKRNRQDAFRVCALLFAAEVGFAPCRTLAQTMSDVLRLGQEASKLQEEGRLQDAEAALKQSVAISEQALGPRHLYIATQLSNLAAFYRAHGDPAEAESLLLRALEIRQRLLGPNHPDIAKNQKALARLREAAEDGAARAANANPEQLIRGAKPILADTRFIGGR